MKVSNQLSLSYIRTKFRILTAISTSLAAREAFKLFCTPPTRDVKELTPIFQQAEELNLSFAGYNIRGYRWNKKQGKKVLIVHGFESTAINFSAYVPGLIERGMEVLSFDAPAHGRSSGKTMNALIYADFIRHINMEYGPINSYLGHSLGALCICLAMDSIEHDVQTRIALVSPATETTTAINHFCNFLRLNEEVRNKFTGIITKVSGREISWISISRAIEDIKATILWVHDEEDKITPLGDANAIMKANLPNIEFMITTGLGHSRIYRDAAVISRIVHFL